MGHTERWSRLSREAQSLGCEAGVLMTAARRWRECSEDAPADFRNAHFLPMFAVYLVQQFRAEEEMLDLMQSPERHRHCRQHHRLAQQMRELMANLERGLELTEDLHIFRNAWATHQEGNWLAAEAPFALAH